MGLMIPDDILSAAGMSPEELRQELAIMLFQRERLTLAQAAQLAQLSLLEMQRLLASRDIPMHYDEDDLADDVRTLRELGLL